jgi:hypothetical protein
MKIRIILLVAIFGVLVGCKGKDGRDGVAGGSMQVFESTTSSDPFGVQVDSYSNNTTVSVYYALPSSATTFYEMKGPDSLPSSNVYYEILLSGSSALIRMHNLTIGSTYRIQVWRS